MNISNSTNLSNSAVRTSGLRKSYRTGGVSTPVLKGVDLEVQCGECVYLVGPSGCGKSTLLSILGCVLSPDGGVVEILGTDVAGYTKKQQARIRREGIGFVFQRFHLFRGLSALENVSVAFNLLGYSARTAKDESYRLLQRVDLAEKADSRIDKLSMGQRQRVAVARALAGDPQIILADEPTASLDAVSGRGAMQLLKRLTKDGTKAVIVVTHDSRILDLADRILRLDDGQLVSSERGPAQPIISSAT